MTRRIVGVIRIKRRKRVNKGLSQLQVAIIAVAAVLALVLLYQGGRMLERRMQKPETRGDYRLRESYMPTIDVDGVTYRQRKGLTSILLMGIDRDSDDEPIGYRDGGQSDFLRLVVLDSRNKTLTQLQIDRDTMTPITILGVMGNNLGMRTAQLCLSHGFGNGREQSCAFTMEAVTNLLFNAPIDFYLAMNLDGISDLNDLVGGVTVTLEDDFTSVDPTMTQGRTLTLQGDQAEKYVRSRMTIGVGTNEARMARQQTYLDALSGMLDARMREDRSFIGTVFDTLEPHMLTSLSRGRLINEVWAAREYARTEPYAPQGTHKIGSDGYMEFWVDENDLRRIVLDLFYERVE